MVLFSLFLNGALDMYIMCHAYQSKSCVVKSLSSFSLEGVPSSHYVRNACFTSVVGLAGRTLCLIFDAFNHCLKGALRAKPINIVVLFSLLFRSPEESGVICKMPVFN